MEEDETYRRILKAKISLHKEFPFFYDLLFFMKISDDTTGQVPSMAVDLHGNKLYNKGFVGKLSADDLRTVLCHEVLHKSLLHIPRGIGYLRLSDKMKDMPNWDNIPLFIDTVQLKTLFCQINAHHF